jgi:ferric-dicitrate binding protein FerR (iron transport regulator)
MTHVAPDTLWAFAQGSLDEGADTVRAHLERCDGCAAQLEDVRAAQAVLLALPEPEPMPEAVARRVGAALAEELDRRAARTLRAWWTRLLEPRFALAFAATSAVGALLVLSLTTPSTKMPMAGQSHEAPAQLPLTKSPTAASAPKLTARVASARKAKVSKAQVLSEGATVTTEAGGSAWLRLPDGSRAGLTGSSQVTLSKLEARTLALEVKQGSLVLAVPHREDRVLTVTAGEVQVRDLGTRFVVSRTEARVLVAVEEGSVEVTTPVATKTVTAGHALTWKDGQLESMKWESAAPTERRAVAPGTPGTPPEAPSPAVAPKGDDEPPELEPSAANIAEWSLTPEQWDELPPGRPAQPMEPPATPSPLPPTPPAPPLAKPKERFSLSFIERRLLAIKRELEGPAFTSEARRERRASDVARLADANDCIGALAIADRWLVESRSRSAREHDWNRAVLTQKLRCLTKLGRLVEADLVRQELAR